MKQHIFHIDIFALHCYICLNSSRYIVVLCEIDSPKQISVEDIRVASLQVSKSENSRFYLLNI